MAKRKFGGSFAPPMTRDDLTRYKSLANSCDDRECKEKMLELIQMMEVFWETGESQEEPTGRHPAGPAVIVPLAKDEIDRIWDYVPWPNDLPTYQQAFRKLPDGDRRNAAHHLLWYATELAFDREPLTNDKLVQ